jgi:hypothetical protein
VGVDELRYCSADQFCTYLANDLVMVNILMFFKELEEALSHIPRLKWHGVGPLEHETFYNELLYRQEKVNPSPHGRINAPSLLPAFAHTQGEAGTPTGGIWSAVVGRNSPVLCAGGVSLFVSV